MSLKRSLLALILLSVCGSVFIFQNCSNPSVPTGPTAEQLAASNMEFAYEASFDQIAYMSCPNLKDNYDPDMFFSFRAGAYKTGGIKLADSFFQAFQKKTTDAMVSMLQQSPANSNTVMQLAIRQKGALNTLILASGTATKGVDYHNMLTQLGTSEMATRLVSTGVDLNQGIITGKRTRYMRDGTPRGAHMEGSLYFGTSESLATDLRENFLNSGRAWLALTYVEPSSGGSADTDVRTPYTVWPTAKKNDPGVAFGKGYQIMFDKPVGSRGLIDTSGKEIKSHPMNLMMSVTERNLDTSSAAPNGMWTCDPRMRFKIVRAEDLADAGCARAPDPDPSQMAPWQTQVRNSLRYEDWYIDWAHSCIVPKKLGSCYGNLNYVQYNDSLGCDKDSTTSSNSKDSRVCVAWVSICTSTN